jgi:hypothetical protein
MRMKRERKEEKEKKEGKADVGTRNFICTRA